MGHDDDARRVLLEKERLQRRARRQRVRSWPWRRALEVKDALLYVTVGFGRVPLLAFVWLFAIWVGGVGIYGAVAANDALRPNIPIVLRSPEWVLCGVEAPTRLFVPSLGTERTGLAAPGRSQLACYRAQPEAATFPPFNMWMYSLDVLLPAMQIGHQTYGAPNVRQPWGYAGRIFLDVQVIMGWALSLLAVAGFSGIVKTRRPGRGRSRRCRPARPVTSAGFDAERADVDELLVAGRPVTPHPDREGRRQAAEDGQRMMPGVGGVGHALAARGEERPRLGEVGSAVGAVGGHEHQKPHRTQRHEALRAPTVAFHLHRRQRQRGRRLDARERQAGVGVRAPIGEGVFEIGPPGLGRRGQDLAEGGERLGLEGFQRDRAQRRLPTKAANRR
jgi:hypothetical protein